ncbi:MAG: hypothetical protein ACKO9H_17005 [Planctomycetota bacterium]
MGAAVCSKLPLFLPEVAEKAKKGGTLSENLSSQGLSQIDSSRSESEHKNRGVALHLGLSSRKLGEFCGFFQNCKYGLSFAIEETHQPFGHFEKSVTSQTSG